MFSAHVVFPCRVGKPSVLTSQMRGSCNFKEFRLQLIWPVKAKARVQEVTLGLNPQLEGFRVLGL